MTELYPVTLRLEGVRCLVVGGGVVALAKIEPLLAAGARPTVVAPEVHPALAALAAEGQIALEQRPYRDGDTRGHALVLTTTDDPQVNAQVAAESRQAGLWVNVADDAGRSTFHLPARVRRGGLQIAVSTGGAAPFAARRLRQALERLLPPAWGEWLAAAAQFRQWVRALDLPAREQARRFDAFFRASIDPVTLALHLPPEDELRKLIGERSA